jgi:prepilin-type N-terminal cleavage/methylation domain-containing protein
MKTSSRRSGFSLVELLTVIGIIAILAAIIFPVMGVVKNKARENNCMANLKNISLGLDLYKKDMKCYPNALVPYVNGQPMDMAKSKSGLYNDEYCKSPSVLHCPSSNVTDKTLHVAAPRTQTPTEVYLYSSYDGVKFGNVYEQHYCLNWATDVSQVDQVAASDGNTADYDYQRQLCWRNPPSDTLVTWCSAHESRDAAGAITGQVIVLFLGGEAVLMDAKKVEQQCLWRSKRP